MSFCREFLQNPCHKFGETIINPTDEFWLYLDQLIQQSTVIIDRPAGQPHPRYPDVIYPFDYGYLENTQSSDSAGIDIWRGKSGEQGIIAVVVTVDLLKRDSEIKLLLGCNEKEMQIILDFHNGDGQRALLIRRK